MTLTIDLRLSWLTPLMIQLLSASPELLIPLGPVRTQEVKGLPMPNPTITITDVQAFDLGPVTGADARGNPVPLAHAVTFTSNADATLQVQDHGDNTATALAVGPVGTAQVTVTDGTLTVIVDVTIIASTETTFQIPLGAPRDQQLPPTT